MASDNYFASSSDVNTKNSEVVYSEIRLHKLLSVSNIEELQNEFKDSLEQKVSKQQLQSSLRKYDIKLEEEQLTNLFMKINANRDGFCNWNEFITYLLIGFHQDDPSNYQEMLHLPISEPITIQNSGHKFTIIGICFLPSLFSSDETLVKDKKSGCYLTVSKDGNLNFLLSSNLEMQRTFESETPFAKGRKTSIVTIISLADAEMLCTSSIEEELCFYDISESNFRLRLLITSFPWVICAMDYSIGEKNAASNLILGDMGGSVYLIELKSKFFDSLRTTSENSVISIRWSQLLNGKLPLLKVLKFSRIHSDSVRQVRYSKRLKSIFSAAECYCFAGTNLKCCGVVKNSLGSKRQSQIFHIPLGSTCFDVDSKSLRMITGGSDSILRYWNIIIPDKPIFLLRGHCAEISYVFIQSDENKIYSIDKKRIIKIWDSLKQNLIQTYSELTNILTSSPFTCFYNRTTHDLLLAGTKIVMLNCCPLTDYDHTDGVTHLKSVSVILYNSLFKSIVTCGNDSNIIVWNPFDGKRLNLIREAHAKIEITAACFNPSQLLLLSGAIDGTLKIWSFNNGLCLRNLNLKSMCEIKAVFWISDRILINGQNRYLSEFSDDRQNEEYYKEKSWDYLHNEDIVHTALKMEKGPSILTASQSGELFFWTLHTGKEPYKKLNIQNITIPDTDQMFVKSCNKYKITESTTDTYHHQHGASIHDSAELHQRFDDQENSEVLTCEKQTRRLSITSLLFLETRLNCREYGSLLVALDNGTVQCYSHHESEGCLDSFNALHMPADRIVVMTTDIDNKYLFTGTALGYIKTWLIQNFCVPEADKVNVNMPKLRLQFSFLLKDRFEGRAKRAYRPRNNPILLNSFKAHSIAITCLEYIDQTKILISGSQDCSVRLWSLGGRYLGSLGTNLPWIKLSPMKPVDEIHDSFRIPPDIRKSCSSTTLKVLTAAKFDQ